MMDERGVAYTYVVGIIAVFICLFIWWALTPVMQELWGVEELNENNEFVGSETREALKTAWNWLPFVMVIFIVIWMFTRSQREIYGVRF